MEKIEIKQFDVEFEKEIESQMYYIELHDTYFVHIGVYDSKVPEDKEDLLRGWNDVFRDFELRFKRENFVLVERFWDDKQSIWQIDLEINGYPNTVTFYFKNDDKKEMQRVFDLLFKWVFKV